jgi:hypothetical protein
MREIIFRPFHPRMLDHDDLGFPFVFILFLIFLFKIFSSFAENCRMLDCQMLTLFFIVDLNKSEYNTLYRPPKKQYDMHAYCPTAYYIRVCVCVCVKIGRKMVKTTTHFFVVEKWNGPLPLSLPIS